MQPLLERIDNGETLLADGAMGTMLLQRGLKPGECPESLNLGRPGVLEEIAALYLEAGAEIIETNTFGASPLKLAQYGLEDRMDEINRAAVREVRKAVGDRAYVAVCCGPSGRMLQPYGDADPDDVYESFRQQLTTVIDAGADLICIETMIDLAEASLAVKAARDVAPDIPITATMTFDDTPNGFHTIMGVSIADAAAGLQEAGANFVGSNCGNGIDNMIRIARDFRDSADTPVIIQSNAGLPRTEGNSVVYPETPEFMADKAAELLALGVAIVGGCCGTTPDHTRALRALLDTAAR